MNKLVPILLIPIILIAGLIALYEYMGSSVGKENIFVSAAPVIQPLLSALSSNFTSQTGINLTVSYDASGTTLEKLRLKAPIDIAIFASEDWGKKAEMEGLVKNDTKTKIGVVLLFLYVKKDLNVSCIDDLGMPGLKVGIPNPSVAPAGYEAMRIINSSKNKDDILKNIVVAKDMGQLVTWYKMGAVDAAFIWSNFAVQLANTSRIIYPWSCGYETKPFYFVGYVTSYTNNTKAALKFLQYLNSPEALGELKKLGYFTSVEEAYKFMGKG
ncbi:MAG: molybdate ABC transporter substrate-binding protein [Fervidicoccaceae archaeon]